MSYLRIQGGRPLSGHLTVQQAKNSVLPVLAATLLAGGECRIADCPRLSDVETAAEILLFLANNPERNRAADIVRGRGMSKGHVSLSLRSLEDRGLVTCQADGSDRRAVHLALTDGAGEIAEDGRAVQREFIRRLREGITPEESAVILSVTRKMGDNIRAMERERGSI